MPTPFITKPNRGGKGLGVLLFQSHAVFDDYVSSPQFESSPDGVMLLQEYSRPPEPFITRCEFVGGRFLHAIRSNTSDGFEICPADGCAPCGINVKFALRKGFEHPILGRLAKFGEQQGLDIFGAEFIERPDARLVTYDLNATTNYNPAVEAEAGTSGTAVVAALLRNALFAARC